MLIFDQLKRNDPQLRLLAMVVLAGMLILLAGLWWVQIVSVRDYREHVETQSFRTVRIPAARGKILDRNGVALADNRPSYNISLYLEELQGQFKAKYRTDWSHLTNQLAILRQAEEKRLNRSLTKQERKQFAVNSAMTAMLQEG